MALLTFKIFTLFPDFVRQLEQYSIIGRAIRDKKIELNVINIRDYSELPYKKVDDYEYGGGAGMLMRPDVLDNALKHNLEATDFCIHMSPRGEVLTQSILEKWEHKNIAIICGHYKGIDQRVINKYVDKEYSIGDYILSGGELAAMVFVDGLARLQPGVIGDIESAKSDSISYKYLLDCDRYTRPLVFDGIEVPEVLRSGDHKEVEKWQIKNRIKITRKRRPDLFVKFLTNQGDLNED